MKFIKRAKLKIIIFGTNDIARLAKFYFDNDSSNNVVAFCVDSKYLVDDKVENLPVTSFEEVENLYPPKDHCFFAPLYDNKLRENKSKEIKKKGYELTSYVSSKATVWSPVGENCFIMEDNTIQPYVDIGNNVIMWSGNHIGHHGVIKDNVFFSSHVVLSGHCVVERYCWLGVNSTIKDHITLSEGTFVAMSAVITKNTQPYKKYMGIPAKEHGDVEI